ncbi:MAG: ribonucleoside-diphosphate reductase, adenosylcobalamin-dependent, partial [Planctomycetes bacterium]|nr:ribonucleoside-diphosphate reductase, adenosylcobalamin-dependent [Planctomycetota bacterium]
PNGACLLGSFNMVKYVRNNNRKGPDYMDRHYIDLCQLAADIPHVVRAMDNIVDRAHYPLPAQKYEAVSKRRMGLGITGVANAIEACGHSYGSQEYVGLQSEILRTLRDECYRASALLAREKGAFQLYDPLYCKSTSFATLPEDIQQLITTHGIRNSHLISIAPTGTIS